MIKKEQQVIDKKKNCGHGETEFFIIIAEEIIVSKKYMLFGLFLSCNFVILICFD